MDALLIVIGIIVGIPIVIYLGVLGFAVFGGALALAINGWPLIVGVPIGIYVSNNGQTLIGVLIIIGSIVLEFVWLNYWDDNK